MRFSIKTHPSHFCSMVPLIRLNQPYWFLGVFWLCFVVILIWLAILLLACAIAGILLIPIFILIACLLLPCVACVGCLFIKNRFRDPHSYGQYFILQIMKMRQVVWLRWSQFICKSTQMRVYHDQAGTETAVQIINMLDFPSAERAMLDQLWWAPSATFNIVVLYSTGARSGETWELLATFTSTLTNSMSIFFFFFFFLLLLCFSLSNMLPFFLLLSLDCGHPTKPE